MIVIAGTTYRTGTTLVQRLINTSDEYLIYGEDNAILQCINNYLVFNHKNKLRSESQTELFKKNKNSFTPNMLPLEDMPTACSYFVNYLYSGRGFKVLSPTLPQIQTLNGITTKLKIVLMYRNVYDSWASYQNIYNWVDRKTFFSYFNKSRTLLKAALRGELDYVYPMRYENISRDTVNKLFDWLNISNRSKINEVLDLKLREMTGFDRDDQSYLISRGKVSKNERIEI